MQNAFTLSIVQKMGDEFKALITVEHLNIRKEANKQGDLSNVSSIKRIEHKISFLTQKADAYQR